MQQKYLQRRKAKPGDLPDTAAIAHLREFRADCKEQDLSLECAMATTLMAVIRFDIAFRTRPLGEWMGYLGTLRREMRNLKKTLRLEYDPPAQVTENTDDAVTH